MGTRAGAVFGAARAAAGVFLIVPSYEVKSEFSEMPKLAAKLHRKWLLGVLVLWYPILVSGAERGMVRALEALEIESALLLRCGFPSAREGHGMVGSGLFVVNPPWGLETAAGELGEELGP